MSWRVWGWLHGVILGLVVVMLVPGNQGGGLSFLIGFSLSGLGYLIGRAAE